MQDHNADLPEIDELSVLKQRAQLMGITFHPNIGLDKLREKVAAHLSTDEPSAAAIAESNAAEEVAQAPQKETPAEYRARRMREATALVRIRVTCMNPAKREWQGEIITAGNSLVGTHRKYVPFNGEPWHVPRIIYNQLIERQCQVFHTVPDGRGGKMRKGKLIKEFAIEVLPNLTKEELRDLAQRQAMANGTSEE